MNGVLRVVGWTLFTVIAIGGCHAARTLAPPPPLRAASAATYAVDVEFAEPLDRASAENPAHYSVRIVQNTTPSVVSTATLVDTLYGRTVQLVIPDWFASNPDSVLVEVTTREVLTVDGASTGTRSTTFLTGLSYAVPVRALLDSRCSSCHGAARASGNYRTDGYQALQAGGTDTAPNLIPGDPGCLLVRKCRPRNSMFDLGGLTFMDYDVLMNWIVSYQARR